MRKIDLTNFRVATSETARLINRRIALNLVRRHQPLSRADLARRSGLQRSTVSAIVEQLIGEGWVTEGAAESAPRGRRPRVLHLNVERAGILGVDLRPETTTVGLAGIDARFLMQTTFATPSGPTAFIAALKKVVAAIRAAHPHVVYEGVGVSVPGRIDASGRLVFAPNLGWSAVDLRQDLEKALGLPAVVENAANACALAELWFGLHPDHVRDLVAVTVSEGIGIGMLINGQLVHGGNAMAGEFGHVTIDPEGPECRCGRRGCWERYASNSAAVQFYDNGLPDTPGDVPPTHTVARFAEILQRYRDGDARAGHVLDRMAHYLGVGLAGVAIGLAPEVAVIVGDVTAAWDRVGPTLEREFRARALPGTRTRIVSSDGAMQPRLRGAVTLVVQQHFGAPNVA